MLKIDQQFTELEFNKSNLIETLSKLIGEENSNSLENSGKLIKFIVEEGQILKKRERVGLINTIELNLKKEQLPVSKNTIISKSKGILPQLLKTLGYAILMNGLAVWSYKKTT